MKTFPDPNQKLDYKNIQKIVYVDCVLKKVMHVMPPCWCYIKNFTKTVQLDG